MKMFISFIQQKWASTDKNLFVLALEKINECDIPNGTTEMNNIKKSYKYVIYIYLSISWASPGTPASVVCLALFFSIRSFH